MNTKGKHVADVTIDSTGKDELPDVLALLDECKLPKEGLADHLSTTLVARKGSRVVGCSALELYRENALLRSVAVEPSFRGQRLGERLVRAALDLARDRKASCVYLLTETASRFFSKLGFESIQRSDVPEEVRRSVEFTSLCPETATVMMISLRQES
jgi:amino-acid N-acetyltransferase